MSEIEPPTAELYRLAMILRHLQASGYSERLVQAVKVGMVQINPLAKTATILAPPNSESLTDDDWLAILGAAGEMREELTARGYEVSG